LHARGDARVDDGLLEARRMYGRGVLTAGDAEVERVERDHAKAHHRPLLYPEARLQSAEAIVFDAARAQRGVVVAQELVLVRAAQLGLHAQVEHARDVGPRGRRRVIS
jgi:hypothetical protein